MAADPHLYYRRVCLTNSEDNLYYNIPILSAIKPDAFVSSVLQQSPSHQWVILKAFKLRYEHDDLKGRLAPEHPWLALVSKKLLQKAKRMPPKSKYQLTRCVELFIAPFL
jgi:hypothetical protein